MLEESMSFGDLPLEIHYSILDLDTHKVKVMFRIVVKDPQLLKNKLHGDIDNAENQVFEEWIFLEERQNQTIEGNKGVVRQVEGI